MLLRGEELSGAHTQGGEENLSREMKGDFLSPQMKRYTCRAAAENLLQFSRVTNQKNQFFFKKHFLL